ncbi:hypothetical protein PMAYCL1PPCAC_05936, partial [Pristionchus mayeri]
PAGSLPLTRTVNMDVDLYPITYGIVAFYGAIMLIGIFTNAAVAFASYQDKKLRNTCNILIALASLVDCLHLTGHIVLIYSFASGNLLTNSYTCVWIEFLPMIGQNSGCVFIVVIAIDRLLACLFPIWYRRKKTILYIFCHLSGVSLYVSYHFFNIFSNIYPVDLICMVPSNYLGEAKLNWWFPSLGCSLLSVIVYTIVAIRIKTANLQGSQIRMFKSLGVIFASVICGNVGTFTLANVFNKYFKGPDFKMEVLMDLIIGIPVNLSLATNYLVYYATSSEYRRGFKRQISVLTGKSWRKRGTASVSSLNA